MRRTPLFWKLFPSYLLVTVLSLLVAGLAVRRELRDHETERSVALLADTAKVFAAAARSIEPGQLGDFCRRAGELAGTRFTVITADGAVLADSQADPAGMENHADRYEVRQALDGKTGIGVRRSPTLGRDMLYVAYMDPQARGGPAVFRAAEPLKDFESRLGGMLGYLAAVLCLVALAAAGFGLWASRRVSRPLERLRQGVERIGGGDLETRLPLGGIEEAARVAQAVNHMADDLSRHIQTILLQQSRQQAILLGMGAPVLAVDREGRVIFANQAAQELFGAPDLPLAGRHILEVTSNTDLHDFIEEALRSEESLETEIVWSHGEDRYFQARSAPLRDSTGAVDGTLAVLAEVTRLRKLELARRDFAANASHELRTPITSIRGFAETLRDQTVHDPERSARFLDIILRQAGRLEALIEDLLFIATLESLGEAKAILLERMPLKPLVDAAATTCRPAAEKKDIRILTRCEPDLIAPANAEILERALTNLVDNAVKFSPEGSTVTVTARRDGDMALLSVADQGPGIAPEDQKRIFERFYRVDKSRSRREGGTGLGLSIVKHAALAHKGNASLTSAPGAGSVFTITLPLSCSPSED